MKKEGTMKDTAGTLAWLTTRDFELSADQVLLVESLPSNTPWLRRLTHVDGHPIPDLTLFGRRLRASLRMDGGAALLLTGRKTRLTCHHAMRVAPLGVERLCRSLAFADAALEVNPEARHPGAAAAQRTCGEKQESDTIWVADLPLRAVAAPLAVEHWIALQALQRSEESSELLWYLRRQESYHLTCYLLQPESESADLVDLAARYGLSYSQFRKLCKRTLGASAKAQRNRWRAARALLGLILNEHSVLDAAVANGYASASHISADIRREFGVTPSTFIHAHRTLFASSKTR